MADNNEMTPSEVADAFAGNIADQMEATRPLFEAAKGIRYSLEHDDGWSPEVAESLAAMWLQGAINNMWTVMAANAPFVVAQSWETGQS